MRKWGFLGLMFGLSLLNGGFFVRDTLRLMGEGIAGVDNQASLLFIPIFWIIAAAVLLVIYAWALIYGIRIERRYRFRAAQQLVCLSELSRRELVGWGAFFAVTGLLMWAALELSVEYALSGGGCAGLPVPVETVRSGQGLRRRRRKGECTMRRIYGIAAALLLAGAVCSGCSAGSSGTEDPDLVVYNDRYGHFGKHLCIRRGGEPVCLSGRRTPSGAGGGYRFEVDELGPVWVELWDLDGNQVGRRRVNLGAERVYVTLEEHSRMTVGTAAPWFR